MEKWKLFPNRTNRWNEKSNISYSTQLLENLKTVFGADLRSIAFFRVFIALVTIGDLMNRWGDIHAHYSDSGVLPRHLVMAHFTSDYWLSVHLMTGLELIVQIIFIVHIIVCLSMAIGFYSRLSTFLTWFLLTSLQTRNILVCHGGDVYHRVLLFFAMFLPLGDCWSVDNALWGKNRGQKRTYSVLSVATFTIAVQICLVYVSSFFYKTGKEWTIDGTATWMALQLDFFRTIIGDMILMIPEQWLRIMTHFVLWWEGYGALFLFSPIYSGPLRTFGAFGFAMMHLGFTAALRIGQFGAVGFFGVLVLTPGWFWDTFIFPRLRTPARIGVHVYYPKRCKICSTLIVLFCNFFLLAETPLTPSLEMREDSKENTNFQVENQENEQSHSVMDIESGKEERPSRGSNRWLLVKDSKGRYHSNVNGLVVLLHLSPLLWPLERIFRNAKISALIRLIMSIHEHDQRKLNLQVNKSRSNNAVILEESIALIKKIFSNLICLFFLYFIITWNTTNAGHFQYGPPESLKFLGWVLHLDQSWSMFSPRPPNVHWHYLIETTLDNGKKGELFRNEGLFRWETNEWSWDKPENPDYWRSFKNHRWFKYYENGINTHPQNEQLRLNYGRYICREYNSRHFGTERLYQFSIHWIAERAEVEWGTRREPYSKQVLWNHICYDKK